MFETIVNQYGDEANQGVCSHNCEKNSDKNLVISFSLLMRLFEWCHEDAKDDVEMHKVMEKLVAFNDGVNPLTIDVYDCLINDVNCPTEIEYNDCTCSEDSNCCNNCTCSEDSNCCNNCTCSEDSNCWNNEIEPSKPCIITLQGEEQVSSEETLDKDVEEEIQNLINMSKM